MNTTERHIDDGNYAKDNKSRALARWVIEHADAIMPWWLQLTEQNIKAHREAQRVQPPYDPQEAYLTAFTDTQRRLSREGRQPQGPSEKFLNELHCWLTAPPPELGTAGIAGTVTPPEL